MDERPTFQVPDIRYRTEVTEADLKKIRALRATQHSLGTSVSLFILDEEEELREEMSIASIAELDLQNVDSISDQELTAIALLGVRETVPSLAAYRKPARAWLVVEQVLKDDSIPPSKLEKNEIYKRLTEMAKEKGYFDIELTATATAANWYTTANALIKRLAEGATPPEIVDFYIDSEGSGYSSQNREKERQALIRGKERFHQIWEAAQEAGLG